MPTRRRVAARVKRTLEAVEVTQVDHHQGLLINAGALQGAIFNSARISIIGTDAKGVIQIFNAGAELMFGYKAEEVMHKVMPADLYDLEDVNARGQALSAEFGKPIGSAFEALAYRAALGVEDTYELKKIRKDGTRFPGAVTVTTLRDTANAIIGYLLIGTDNTERKKAEDKHRWTEDGFRMMVESVTDCAILQLDPEGTVLSWNAGAQRIKGFTAEEIIGQNISRFYSKADIEQGRPRRDLDTAAARGRLEEERWGLRKDGTSFWSNSVFTAMRDRTGSLRGFARLTRDLTERRQIEQALSRARDDALQASRAKSEFLANMSHEIRTPMNGVIGMTEVLQDTALTQTQRYAVETIRFSGQSLLTIINDILDFSKIEAGMLRLDIVDVDVRTVLARVIGLFEELATDKGLKLNLVVDEGVPAALRGDPGRLYQVLTNLVSNAVKFTETGEISVHAGVEREAAADALLRFSVRDSGIGVPKEAQTRLFQPFMQADGSTTRKYGGSGLGLAISKQLAEVMGGAIGVDSAPGKGSTFWFTARLDKGSAPMARETPAAESRVDEPQAPPPAPSHAWRVLVAEDNRVNQKVARDQLKQLGLTADIVEDGRTAVDAHRRKAYDIILMDCQMPVLDGYAATAEIRAAEGPDQRAWIIAMTAHAMGGDRDKCMAAGMDDYLAKPVLRKALREALQRFEQRTLATPVNLDVLWDAAGGDAGFARELADEYVIQTGEQLKLLRAALEEGSADALQQVAHACKGGSDTCGAAALSSLLQQVEGLGREGKLDQAGRAIAGAEREFARVQAALVEFPARPAGPGGLS